MANIPPLETTGVGSVEEPSVAAQDPIVPQGTMVELPYHFDANGKPLLIELQQDIPQSELQKKLNTDFPRTPQAIALQMMDKGAAPVSEDDFNFVKEQSKLMDEAREYKRQADPSKLSQIAQILPHAVKEIVGGAYAAAKAGAMLAAPAGATLPEEFELAQRAQANAAGSLLEGFLQGTEKGLNIAGLAASLGIGDYRAYTSLKQLEADEIRRQAGETILPGLSPEAAREATKISNFLDATALFPFVGKFLGTAGKATAEQMVANLAKESTVGVTRQVVGKIAEKTGSAVGAGVKALTKAGAETIGREGLAGSALRTAGGAVGAIPALVEWGGKLIASEAPSKTIAEGIKAAQEAGKSGTMLRAVAKVLPPDSVLRAAGAVADSSILGAMIGTGVSGVQAAADPFNTKMDVLEQMAVGGATGGTVGGFFGVIPGAMEMTPAGRNRVFLREMAKDIVERPETRSFIFNEAEYPVNDVANRIKILNNRELSTTEKAQIFAITKSAEYAGHDVGFVDNGTLLPDSIGGSGENMGRGVRVLNDNEGRSTILINVDQINPGAAVEEVTHAFIGQKAAEDIVAQLIKDRGGLSAALEPLIALGQRYYETQKESNPEAAAEFGKYLQTAQDANQPASVRQAAAVRLAEEWAAMGVGEILTKGDPRILETARGTQSIFQPIIRGLENLYAGLMTQPSAASFDPITGFFYKDGKLIQDKTLQSVAQKLQDSILYGHNMFPQDFPVGKRTRTEGTAPRPASAIGVRPGDVLPDGTRVLGVVPRPRYEDTHAEAQPGGEAAGSPVRTKLGSKKAKGQADYHQMIFDQLGQIVGESAVDPAMVQAGGYFGELTKVEPGSPIIRTKAFTDAELAQLFQVQTHHGRPLIAPESREAIARFNQAAKDSQLIVVDHDIALGKNVAGREYGGRVQRVLLPLGMQQTPKGGPIAGVYNMSLLNELVNFNRSLKGMEPVDAALKQFGITSLEDLVPFVKAYLENYSSPNPVPAVELFRSMQPKADKQAATVLRDLMYLSNNIQPRKSFQSDVQVNVPQNIPISELPKEPMMAYDIYGRERPNARLYRDRNVFSDLRLDSIHNVQLYAGRGGLPVSVNVNLEKMIPTLRSNFSPKRSIRETLGESTVVSDQETGRRAFVAASGKTKVFESDGSLQGVYESLLDAQTKLNKSDYNAEAVRLANSTARSAGAVGAKAITPQYVASTITAGDSVLNFGAGKPDKTTGKYLHSEIIRSSGGKVDEYDFGSNATGSLDKKYNTVFASNVLNVQSSPQMLETTLSQIWDRVNESGRAVFNYPSSPRYLQMSPKEVAGTIEKVTGITPVRVGGTSSTPLWEVSKIAPPQANFRFSPRSPAAVRRAAEKAQELRGKMESEAPSRLMATWLSELAAQKAQAAEPAQPQRAKGKLPIAQAELAAINARTREITAVEKRFPGMAQLSSGQREIFLRDLAEAESGITARALARIAEQSAPAGPRARRAAAAGQLSQAEQAALKANVDAKLAARDVPVLEADEVRELFSRKRQRAPRAALEASAMSEVPAEFFKREMEPPKPTPSGVYKGFEALSAVGLPREQAPAPLRIPERATDLLAEGKAIKNMEQVLRQMADVVRKMPKREPVLVETTKAAIPPTPDPVITPAQEPRLPSDMLIIKSPSGNFKLYSITQQGKAVQEAVGEVYGDVLGKAQRKHLARNKNNKSYATP